MIVGMLKKCEISMKFKIKRLLAGALVCLLTAGLLCPTGIVEAKAKQKTKIKK